jgi:hypothetical protein
MGSAQSTLPDSLDDVSFIKWSRGTNTSIFLSYYKKDGKYWLMSKGDQIRNGFVPMLETWAVGIAELCGINWIGISGNVGELATNAVYADSTKPYNQTEVLADVNATAKIIIDEHAELTSLLPLNDYDEAKLFGIYLSEGSKLFWNAARCLQYDKNAALDDGFVKTALEIYNAELDKADKRAQLYLSLVDSSKNPLAGCEALDSFVKNYEEWKDDPVRYIQCENGMRNFLGLPSSDRLFDDFRDSQRCPSLERLMSTQGYNPYIFGKCSPFYSPEQYPYQAAYMSAALWNRVGAKMGKQARPPIPIEELKAMFAIGSQTTKDIVSIVRKILARNIREMTLEDKEILKNPIPVIVGTSVPFKTSAGFSAVDWHHGEYDLNGPVPIGIDPSAGLYTDFIIFPNAAQKEAAHKQIDPLGQLPAIKVYHMNSPTADFNARSMRPKYL